MLINSILVVVVPIVIFLLLWISAFFIVRKKIKHNRVYETLSTFILLFFIFGIIAFPFFWLIHGNSYPTVYIVNDDSHYTQKALIGTYSMVLKNGETIVLNSKENNRFESVWLVNNTDKMLCREYVEYVSERQKSEITRGGYDIDLIYPFSVDISRELDYFFEYPPSSIKIKGSRDSKIWVHFIPEMNMQTMLNNNMYSINFPISLSKSVSSNIDEEGDYYANTDSTIIVKIIREKGAMPNVEVSSWDEYRNNRVKIDGKDWRQKQDNTIWYDKSEDIVDIKKVNGLQSELYYIWIGEHKAGCVAHIENGEYFYKIFIFTRTYRLNKLIPIIQSFKVIN